MFFAIHISYITALVKRTKNILMEILDCKILPCVILASVPLQTDFFLSWFALKMVPYSRLLWWRQEKFFFQRAPLVVCVHCVVPCRSHQWCIWVLYHALWVALRQGELHQVADLHGHLLLGKSFHHTALKGEILRNTTGQYDLILLSFQGRQCNVF